jgi:hypothetical protein
MQCPPEIAEIVCEILRTGLLRIRALGDAHRCALEADHLHNLPTLLANYKPELLDFYLRVERAGFIERSAPEVVEAFEPMWQSLAKHVNPSKSRALAISLPYTAENGSHDNFESRTAKGS